MSISAGWALRQHVEGFGRLAAIAAVALVFMPPGAARAAEDGTWFPGSAEEESIRAVQQPDWTRQPVFNKFFDAPGGQFSPGEGARHVFTALGGDRLFVSAEDRDAVYMYDSATLAHLGTISVGAPLGVSFYRGELYVVDSRAGEIKVFDAAGTFRRSLAPLVGGTSSAPVARLLSGPLGQQIVGIDLAWGEVWASLRSGGTLILDSRTGMVKGVHGITRLPVDGWRVEDAVLPWRQYDRVDYGSTLHAEICLGSNTLGPGCQPRRTPALSYSAGYSVPSWFTQPPWNLPAVDARVYVWIYDTSPQTGATYATNTADDERHRALANWRDVAAMPEAGGMVQGRNLFLRDFVGDSAQAAFDEETSRWAVPYFLRLAPYGGFDPSAFSPYGDGTEAVWGMRWLLAASSKRIEYPSSPEGDYRSARIREYSVESVQDAGGEVHRRFVERRSFTPQDASPYSCKSSGDVCGGFRDVSYNNRDLRIHWSGDLTKSEWLRNTKCLDYFVSDADIYVTGRRGEHWYEPARGIQSVELRVDGSLKASSTTPQGRLCFDTNGVASGVHTLTLTATAAAGTATNTNPDLRLDHDPPEGLLSEPETYARARVTYRGEARDPHSGVQRWHFEVLPPGGTWREACSTAGPPDPQTGRFGCEWDTTTGGDGMYRVRARSVDGSSDGGNVSYTSEAEVEVDNVTEPDAIDGDAVYDETDGYEPGPPETYDEPAAPDDAPDEDEGEGPGGSYNTSCASDDPYTESTAPVYVVGEGAVATQRTLEEARLLFLALPMVPKIPVTEFREEERTPDFAVYGAYEGTERRAVMELVNDPDIGWLGIHLTACSKYADKYRALALIETGEAAGAPAPLATGDLVK